MIFSDEVIDDLFFCMTFVFIPEVRLSKSRSLLVSGLVAVDPGANDFYHLQHAKITGGIFLL